VGLFGTTAFVTIAIYSFVWLNGLSYNTANGSFEQTSIIAVESKAQSVEVWLNGQKYDDKIPTQIRSLKPGLYQLEIHRQFYQTYTKNFVLQPGEVGFLKDVVMIAKKPLVSSLDKTARFIDIGNFSTGLTLTNGELYDGTKFITRFSQNPSKIYRFDAVYLYLTGKEIRLFIPETSQDFPVYSVASDNPTINPDQFSYTVAVKDGNSSYLINLSASSEDVAGIPR
jgi:hypothetical protein